MTTTLVLIAVLVVAVLADGHRSGRAEREQTVLVAEWLGRKGYPDETVADVLTRFDTVTLGDLAEQRRRYFYVQGYDAALRAEHERRSDAARRGAARRVASGHAGVESRTR